MQIDVPAMLGPAPNPPLGNGADPRTEKKSDAAAMCSKIPESLPYSINSHIQSSVQSRLALGEIAPSITSRIQECQTFLADIDSRLASPGADQNDQMLIQKHLTKSTLGGFDNHINLLHQENAAKNVQVGSSVATQGSRSPTKGDSTSNVSCALARCDNSLPSITVAREFCAHDRPMSGSGPSGKGESYCHKASGNSGDVVGTAKLPLNKASGTVTVGKGSDEL